MHAMYFTTLIFHSLPQLLLYPPLLSTLSQLCGFFLIVHWVQVVLFLYSQCRSIHCSVVNQPGLMSLKKTYPPSPRSHPLSVTPQLGIGAFKGPARTMLDRDCLDHHGCWEIMSTVPVLPRSSVSQQLPHAQCFLLTVFPPFSPWPLSPFWADGKVLKLVTVSQIHEFYKNNWTGHF